MAKRETPVVHKWGDLGPAAAYDRTQWDDSVKDGDLFVCDGGKVVGFLFKAWPVILYGEDKSGELHTLAEESKREYTATVGEAERIAKELSLI